MTDTSNTTPITVTDEQFQNTFQMLGSFSKSIKELSEQLRTLQKTFKSADKQSKINTSNGINNCDCYWGLLHGGGFYKCCSFHDLQKRT